MELLALIAKAADACLKPWTHTVIPIDPSVPAILDDLNVRIECRDSYGKHCPDRDLELEIYRSGGDINLMLGWWNQSERPLLWQGRHPVWMHGVTGQRIDMPQGARQLEAFGRRLHSLLQSC
ncbi:hypothetical protein [Synechococcus sp. M16CYN]|uniref:hypothetical protein n=1 Tax=Synechococcus sp. M16CYN TaxID=3103139 RepID=UPI00325219C8